MLRERAPSEASRAGQLAAAHLREALEFQQASEVAVFAPMEDEISTRSVYDAARQAGKRCLFPRCLAEYRLDFAAVETWDDLVVGPQGAREPPPEMAGEHPDPSWLVLVPGLAFDAHGGRLGRGAGYYDRALSGSAGVRPVCFGFGFAFQVVAEVPMESQDRFMDAVLTEQGLLRPDRRRQRERPRP